jgi:uncharacterized protein
MSQSVQMPTALAARTRPMLDRLPDIRAQYGIRKIGIFGSYLRGEENRDSDLDILIEFGDTELTLLDFIRLENRIGDLLGVKVDLVDRSTLKPALRSRILDEVVYL